MDGVGADEPGLGFRVVVLEDECDDLHEVVVELVQGSSPGAASGQGRDAPDIAPGDGEALDDGGEGAMPGRPRAPRDAGADRETGRAGRVPGVRGSASADDGNRPPVCPAMRQAAARSFGRLVHVFRFLAHRTHGIVIPDSRFVDDNPSFRDRKPAGPGCRKPRHGVATVPVDAFIRRLPRHVQRPGMHRIRRFGNLADSSMPRRAGLRYGPLIETSPRRPAAESGTLKEAIRSWC